MMDLGQLNESGLPPWLYKAVRMAKEHACNLQLQFVEGEGLWYAELSGAGTREYWQVKKKATAEEACDHLCEEVRMEPGGFKPWLTPPATA